LAVFVVIQVREAIGFGRANGAVVHSAWSSSARFFVNSERVPSQDRACLQSQVLFFQAGALPSFAIKLRAAQADQLGEFQPNSYRYYRRQGPPPDFFGGCATAPSSGKPESART
jgi:hypothetical protein